MATAPFIHARCGYSLRISNRNNNGAPIASSSSHASSSSFPSCSSSSNSGFTFPPGTNSGQRHQGLRGQAMTTITHGKSIASIGNSNDDPDHLLVLVHAPSVSTILRLNGDLGKARGYIDFIDLVFGLIGRIAIERSHIAFKGYFHSFCDPPTLIFLESNTSDWTYAEAELKRRLGKNFLIYASSSNTYTKTFAGIDGAGKRLADEVIQVVKKRRSLKRISFLAHSLGGLIARYAIAVLYSPDTYNRDQPGDPVNGMIENSQRTNFPKKGTIAGLEPVNFITLATPHLGVRGKGQLPFLLGVPILEKLAVPIAPFLVGRTGSQLFLTDGKPNKPPLLLRMASDSEDGNFLSSLGAFRCRIVYANVSYDHMVGWRTSSIRRGTELGKPPRQSLDGYRHVVDVEYCPPVPSDGPQFPLKAVKAKEAAQNAPNTQNTAEYHEIMEEEIIRGLQQLGWKKVDVSFHSAFWPFFAHNNIHVKNEWLHNAGVGVIAHVADSLRQQEASSILAASL